MDKLEIPQSIIDIYDDGLRVYHTTTHLKEMFKYIQERTSDMSKELYYAVLFHDIVYDINNDNEKQSVNVWLKYVYANPRSMLGLNIDKVSDMIMATKYPVDFNIDDKDTQLLLRADWNILRSSELELDIYEDSIHQEYLNMGGIEVEYRTKRITFLSSVLQLYDTYSDGVSYIMSKLLGQISSVVNDNIHRGGITYPKDN